MKLSTVYNNNCFYVVAYQTGWNQEVELLDKTFTREENAKSYAKANAKNYANGKLIVCMFPFDPSGYFEIQDKVTYV